MMGTESLVLACPACTSRPRRLGPASRTTGSIVATCAECGCHWLSNPAPQGQIADHYDIDRDEYQSFVLAKRQATLDSAYESTLDQLSDSILSGGNVLFDVGAGAGEFLELARRRGFEPHGNELAPGAIELAQELTGIRLVAGDLSTIDGSDLYDAVTMWCVLAHVTDPEDLLAQTFRVLKPGGILFLQTPRWSNMDAIALGVARISRGRWSKVLDRRANASHMVLNSKQGLTTQAVRAGFEIVDISPVARYSLNTHSYLRSLGLPNRPSNLAARGLDVAIDRNFFFRNILDLYARKPLT